MAVRRAAIVSACLAAWLALAPAPASAAKAPAMVLQSVQTSAFPSVALRVMVPPSLTEQGSPSFEVKENGVAVRGVDVRAVGTAGRVPLAVVLVVDTSGSMRGDPLAAAKDAAGKFVSLLGPADQVAVVGFDTRPAVLSPFTSDRAATRAAVDRLQATGETSLYDALIAADTLALTAPSAQRSVVVLSDGGDTRSAATLDAALRFMKNTAVPVFALGLDSPEAAPNVLARIATETRGRAVGVKDASALGGVYEDVARQIQNQYEISFTSAKPATKDLDYEVTGRLGKETAALSTVISNPAYTSLPATLRSTAAALPGPLTIGVAAIFAVAGLVFGCVTLLALLVMRSLTRTPNAMKQLDYYQQVEASDGRPDGVRGRIMHAIGEVAERRGLTGEVQQRLEAAGLPLRPVEYITFHVLFVILVGFVSEVFTGSMMFAMMIIVVAAFAPLVLLDALARRRKAAFARQLPDVLGLVAGSLRAGYGLMQAVEHIVSEAAPPASVEFRRVETEARLGLRVEDALEKMAKRMDSDDFAWTVSAINIQREVGGNLAEVLDIVARTIRDREALRRTVSGLTSEGRLSGVILVVLPFVVGFALFLISPAYIGQLFETFAGWVLVVAAALLMIVGVVWLRQVSRIEV